MRQVFVRSLCAVALAAAPAVVRTQTTAPFTAEDMLKVASINVLDISEDGTRVAATVRRPIDNDVTDHRRFGDPTYLTTSRVSLAVIDVKTGDRQQPFSGMINIRDASWSRDGRRLALLTAREPTAPDAFPSTVLHIWDAERNTLSEVKPAQAVAVNSSLSWSPDGSAIIVALRSAELDRQARRTFKTLTEGPVIVHKSSEPFLEWDSLQRSTRTRAVAALDPRSGAVRRGASAATRSPATDPS